MLDIYHNVLLCVLDELRVDYTLALGPLNKRPNWEHIYHNVLLCVLDELRVDYTLALGPLNKRPNWEHIYHNVLLCVLDELSVVILCKTNLQINWYLGVSPCVIVTNVLDSDIIVSQTPVLLLGFVFFNSPIAPPPQLGIK